MRRRHVLSPRPPMVKEDDVATVADCVLCGGTLEPVLDDVTDTRFGVPGRFTIARCARCGLEQTLPRPSQAALIELYRNHYNFTGTTGRSYLSCAAGCIRPDSTGCGWRSTATSRFTAARVAAGCSTSVATRAAASLSIAPTASSPRGWRPTPRRPRWRAPPASPCMARTSPTSGRRHLMTWWCCPTCWSISWHRARRWPTSAACCGPAARSGSAAPTRRAGCAA